MEEKKKKKWNSLIFNTAKDTVRNLAAIISQRSQTNTKLGINENEKLDHNKTRVDVVKTTL